MMNTALKDLLKIAVELSGELHGDAGWKEVEAVQLSRGGSDRHFFRLKEGGRSVVAMIQPGGGQEFDSYLQVGGFLRRNGIGTPEIYRVDPERGVVIMEDLGDVHLEDALHGASTGEELSLYSECISVLVRLETTVTVEMESEGLLADNVFDKEKFLGETDYFRREFLEGYCRIEPPPGWDEERTYLAERLAGEPPVFMHRDFQSRNILTKEGRLMIVDFQAAHRGPGLYDAASLLRDAYHPLPGKTVRKLLEELHQGLLGGGAEVSADFEEFHDTFVLAGIQRNLQALAAFARLGIGKGKTEFLSSIPNGLNLLKTGIGEAGRFPALERMTDELDKKLNERI